jgi:hypothetical protein
MAKVLPLVFVGSSSEKSEIVPCVAKNLTDIADVHHWRMSDSFKPTSSTLDGLLHAARTYDFGIFVLTPDDVTTSRDTTQFSARDNVLFEFGLFLGALGPKRTMAVMEQGDETLKIPSDLLGVHIPRFTYTSRNNLLSQIGVVLDGFRVTIKRLGKLPPFSLVGGWKFDGDTQEFLCTVSASKMHEHGEKIGNQKLLLVIRKEDPLIAAEEDTCIVKGTLRQVGRKEQNIILKAGGVGCLGDLKRGDKIDGYLLLVPEKAELASCNSIKALEERGCVLLDSGFGVTL